MNPATGAEANVLRYYVTVLRRRWLWVVLGLALGVAAGYASTLLVKEERDPNQYYKATNTLIVDGAGASGSQNVPNLSQAAFLTRAADVTNQLAGELGMTTQAVNDQLSATARSDVLAIDVTAISTDPAQAVALADAAAAALTDYVATDAQKQYQAQINELLDREKALEAERDQLRAVINLDPTNAQSEEVKLDALLNEYRLVEEQIRALSGSGGAAGGLSTLQSATAVQINATAYHKRLSDNQNARGGIVAPVTATEGDIAETDLSVGPPVSKTMRVLIGGAAGLVMGLAMAFLVEAWDDRIRKRERVEAITGLPVIAEVPKLPKDLAPNDIVVIDAPRSRAAERYRSVRTAVLFALHEHLGTQPRAADPGLTWSGVQAPVLMVTSPNPGEGKTTTAANLAAVFADGGMRTLVIDCDYRKPAIARYLAPRPAADDGPLSDTRIDGVLFAPAPRGTGSPGEAVSLLRETIAQWRGSVDMVLLDTPPMLTTNDASDLLAAADAVVLVLRSGQTRSGHAERVSNVLARYRADTLGIVLNSCDDADIDAYYGYYKGYVDDEPLEAKRNGAPVAPIPDRPTTPSPN